MDRIVKASVMLSVQLQRDVKRKRENVLMDARLDGNFRHVIQVRHISRLEIYIYKLITHIYVLIVDSFQIKEL